MKIRNKYHFTRTKDNKQLPKYITDHVFEGEDIWLTYTTTKNHGVFTNKKLILFHNEMSLRQKREIISVPYDNITLISVIYYENKADLKLYLNNGDLITLRIIRMLPDDKMQLRYLYTYILKIINKQKINDIDIERLVNKEYRIEELKNE